jgi:methylenetetrahydrofolate reductase (NADPH)
MSSLSFEFFPPKDDAALADALDAADKLAAYNPAYFSVTYGAGGSTRERTLETVLALQGRTGVPAAAHITCVGQDKGALLDLAEEYREKGVKRLVVLRGDMPNMEKPFRPHPQGFARCAELLAALKAVAPFDTSVAAFPETHPEAASPEADVAFLKEKLDAGADRAITQFCFDTDVLLRFLDTCRAAGIDKPIVPGIMPIRDFAGVRRFAERCGASVPPWLADMFARAGDDPALRRLAGVSVAARQCRILRNHGVTQFHFYCLNRADMTAEICLLLGRDGR